MLQYSQFNSSIYQPTKAHIISHKTLLKHFKTFRHVSILSDHHQGALFLAKVVLQYSQHIPTQHDMLPQQHVCKYELNCEYCNINLARNKAPWWWSDEIETSRSVLKCFMWNYMWIRWLINWSVSTKMHGSTTRLIKVSSVLNISWIFFMSTTWRLLWGASLHY
jgi:hypothetical protein